mmetsp:Transcript_9737/g.29512  ORF Transcript_9737/g.29512 Transcript_9737/m.29512 type:complete len:222 (+) Transcript_9737:462-1127(+)
MEVGHASAGAITRGERPRARGVRDAVVAKAHADGADDDGLAAARRLGGRERQRAAVGSPLSHCDAQPLHERASRLRQRHWLLTPGRPAHAHAVTEQQLDLVRKRRAARLLQEGIQVDGVATHERIVGRVDCADRGKGERADRRGGHRYSDQYCRTQRCGRQRRQAPGVLVQSCDAEPCAVVVACQRVAPKQQREDDGDDHDRCCCLTASEMGEWTASRRGR